MSKRYDHGMSWKMIVVTHRLRHCVRESVRTWDMGLGESHSHPWHVDIRVGMCIFLLECVCV